MTDYPTLIPGVMSYGEYLNRRERLSKHEQMIQLDAEWPADTDDYMYPQEWMVGEGSVVELAKTLSPHRKATSGGCDTAMGGDNTAWAAVDGRGLIALKSMKTPDTSVIPDITVAFMREYGIPPEHMLFDYGGAGKVHVDNLRVMGYGIKTINFGEAVVPVAKRAGRIVSRREREGRREERYTYKNRRAQLYHHLRLLMDPSRGKDRFALPAELLDRPRPDGKATLRQQMRPIPLWYTEEGRIYLPSKSIRSGDRDLDKGTKATIIGLVGTSPDELEAVLLAVYGLGMGSGEKISLVGH